MELSPCSAPPLGGGSPSGLPVSRISAARAVGWPVGPRPCHPAERELTERPSVGSRRHAAGADLRRRPAGSSSPSTASPPRRWSGLRWPDSCRRVDARGARPAWPRGGRRAARPVRVAPSRRGRLRGRALPTGRVRSGAGRAQHGRVHRAAGGRRRAPAVPTTGARRRWSALPAATRGRERRRRAPGHARTRDRAAEHDLRVRTGLPRLLPRPPGARRGLERRHRELRALRPHRGRRGNCAHGSSATPCARTGATSWCWPRTSSRPGTPCACRPCCCARLSACSVRPPGSSPRRSSRRQPAVRPDITIETVADANHYTIVLADRFAARVAHHIEDGGSSVAAAGRAERVAELATVEPVGHRAVTPRGTAERPPVADSTA